MPENPYLPPKEVKPGRVTVDLRLVFQLVFWLAVALLVATWIVLPLWVLLTPDLSNDF
jgi:hypothetical protein